MIPFHYFSYEKEDYTTHNRKKVKEIHRREFNWYSSPWTVLRDSSMRGSFWSWQKYLFLQIWKVSKISKCILGCVVPELRCNFFTGCLFLISRWACLFETWFPDICATSLKMPAVQITMLTSQIDELTRWATDPDSNGFKYLQPEQSDQIEKSLWL